MYSDDHVLCIITVKPLYFAALKFFNFSHGLRVLYYPVLMDCEIMCMLCMHQNDIIQQLWSQENDEHTFPIESPPATDRMTPMTLQTSVLIRTTCGILIPFKKHLICGMPLPAATGYTCKIHSWTVTKQ